MFDFFKEIYLEAKGVDVKALNDEKKREREEKKKNKLIFSTSTKIIIYVFGILYLFVAGVSIVLLKESGSLDLYNVIRFIFISLCDIAALICLAVGKKKTEIAALILIVLFMITQYFSMFLV